MLNGRPLAVSKHGHGKIADLAVRVPVGHPDRVPAGLRRVLPRLAVRGPSIRARRAAANRNFGPDAKPQRGPNAKAKKKEKASAPADRFPSSHGPVVHAGRRFAGRSGARHRRHRDQSARRRGGRRT
jgi:hypothetical protein